MSRMRLNLGVVSGVPYPVKEVVTTDQVARYLEEKYSVMEDFYRANKGTIANEVMKAISRHYIAKRRGHAHSGDVDLPEVSAKFRDYLDRSRWLSIAGNVEPQAAAIGVRTRKMQQIVTGVRRPPFIDTGLYRKSFRAWIDK